MESKDNNNRSEDASKGVGEIGDSAVQKESDKQKADNNENVEKKGENDEKNKEKPIKNGNIPVDAGNAVRKDNENVDIVTCDEKKTGPNTETKDKSKNDNFKKNEKQEKKNDNSEEVIVQKPKRTKSRRSLNKMYSVNNIDVAFNDNASMQRSDR